MSRAKQSQMISNGDMRALKNMAWELQPLFELEGKWTTKEAPGSWEGRSQSILRKARIHNAIEVVGQARRIRSEGGYERTRVHKVYRWHPEIKADLQEYLENLDTLPCGCRKHIKNKGNGNYGCRYCDEERNYPKDLIKELMS